MYFTSDEDDTKVRGGGGSVCETCASDTDNQNEERSDPVTFTNILQQNNY